MERELYNLCLSFRQGMQNEQGCCWRYLTGCAGRMYCTSIVPRNADGQRQSIGCLDPGHPTAMSNPCLPVEILDHIVDLLHDTRDALRNCCLVSQSWIPRTRKHLFADIKFYTVKNLQSWKKTFPDPSTSPACYTKTLFISCPQVVTAADAEGGGWIRTFSRVVRLEVYNCHWTLAPFHGFSPVIKSLRLSRVTIPPSQIINLVLSLPLLEDLAVVALDILIDNEDVPDGLPTVVHPSSLPAFTGSLVLHLKGGMNPITRRLLSLPSGLHFWKLNLTWTHKKDVLLTTVLVERCCSTLESLKINPEPFGTVVWHLHLR